MALPEGSPISADAEPLPVIGVNPQEYETLSRAGFLVASSKLAGEGGELVTRSFAVNLRAPTIPLGEVPVDEDAFEELLGEYRKDQSEQIGDLGDHIRLARTADIFGAVTAVGDAGHEPLPIRYWPLITRNATGFDVVHIHDMPSMHNRGGLRSNTTAHIEHIAPGAKIEGAAIMPILVTNGPSFITE